jgi:catechol 2,3-dioxygenase-like lactoylglutathione lyase family enzyme
MANTFGTDILIQAQDPKKTALFYVTQLGFEITDEKPNLVSLHGEHVNLFIERGPALGPVLEVTVDSVEKAKRRLVDNGCEIIKDEPEFPRCYIKDPFGLTYNLTTLKYAVQRNRHLSGGRGCKTCHRMLPTDPR